MRDFLFYLCFITFFLGCTNNDSSSSGSSNSTSGTLDLSLVVESSSPSDGTSSVSRSTTIAVTFSKAMDPTTIDANYSSTTCSGTIQLSSDGFTTCVRFTSAPVASNSNKTFTVTPASSLSANTLYQIGVLRTNPRDTNGNAIYYSWSANGFVTSGTTIAQFGSSSADYGYDIAIDSSDNLYLVGSANKIHGNYYNGTFLTKYNSSLTRQWTRQTDSNFAKGIHKDYSGNLIFISNNQNYGKFFEDSSISESNNSRIYKYNISGEKIWYSERNYNRFDQLDSTSDNSGNYYFTGSVYDRNGYDFDGNAITNYQDFFIILKYNSSGTRTWTKIVESQSSRGHGIVSDTSGNSYSTGYAKNTFNSVSVTGGKDLFLTKYNTSGTHQWSKLLGSTSDDVGNEIVMDSSGNLYITGYTEGILDGGSTSGERDLLITKYDSSGNKSWAVQVGNTRSEGRSIALDSSNNVYVAGYAYGDFDGNSNIGGSDVVIVKYNSSGVKQWAYQYGTTSDDFGEGIAVDSSGNLYVTGTTSGNFYGNVNAGSSDVFLMKLNSSGVVQ